jgi:beta-lactamase class A
MSMIDRRLFLLGTAALTAGCAGYPSESRRARADFRGLRENLGPGGRLGVAARDQRDGRRLVHDESGRYAMCSTFKLPLVAAILAQVDRGALRLDEEIAFGASDVLDYAPVVQANLTRGRLSVETLCAAAIEVSDNSAANLLLGRIGGPAGLTAFIRGAGDSVTRLDRMEPELNTNLPGDPRDTTSPEAMVGLLRTLLLGETLSAGSRTRLAGWMERTSTGRDRLRAGLPASWRAGDKTGTGPSGAHNDVAIAWPPGRAPILIASFLDGGTASAAARAATHAAVARAAAAAFS